MYLIFWSSFGERHLKSKLKWQLAIQYYIKKSSSQIFFPDLVIIKKFKACVNTCLIRRIV